MISQSPMLLVNSFQHRYPIHFPAIFLLRFNILFGFGLLRPTNVDSKFTVITNFRDLYAMYHFIAKGNREQPSSLDPAIANASTRLQICEDISRSAVFAEHGMYPVDMNETYEQLQQPRYSLIFRTIYVTMTAYENLLSYYAYVNPYRLLEVEINQYNTSSAGISNRRTVQRNEYLFMCVLKKEHSSDSHESREEENSSEEEEEDFENVNDTMRELPGEENISEADSVEENLNDDRYGEERTVDGEASGEEGFNDRHLDDIFPFYVSKVYDAHRGLHAYRFLFVNGNNSNGEEGVLTMLAAETAQVHVRPDFNVELHYIELRKHHRSAENCRHDPVCKLNLGVGGKRKLFQLCTSVLTASYFEDRRVRYHVRMIRTLNLWLKEQVLFRTIEGLHESAGKVYREFLLPCYADTNDGDQTVFYISRAYNPNQVLVYTRDRSNDMLYLECLTNNVSIVQESYNFGDVEV